MRVIRVTALVKRGVAKPLLSSLEAAGLRDWHMSPARTVTLEEKRGTFGLLHRFRPVEDAAEMVSFFVDPGGEEQALDHVIRICELTLPGRGTVFSEEVELISPCGLRGRGVFAGGGGDGFVKQSPLVGICCIVQRGEGNKVARVALDMGASVPVVSFGEGMGIRDRLGLLRIAIPAQKEIIHLAVSTYDAETVMRMMIRAGELDRPAKGFLYLYPIRKGLVDTKITHGLARQMASIEQVIAALDELKGDMAWRKRSERALLTIDPHYLFLNMVDVTVLCNEGTGQLLVKHAMQAGAGGATISRVRYHCPQELRPKGMSSAREACNMCIAQGRVVDVTRALEEAGALGEEASGEIVIREAPKAYTYS
jgi:hypothetical protein